MACCPCLELMKQVGGDGCCEEGNTLSVELVFEHPPRWFRFVSLSRKRTLVYRCLLCETRISKEVREIRRMVQYLFIHYYLTQGHNIHCQSREGIQKCDLSKRWRVLKITAGSFVPRKDFSQQTCIILPSGMSLPRLRTELKLKVNVDVTVSAEFGLEKFWPPPITVWR